MSSRSDSDADAFLAALLAFALALLTLLLVLATHALDFVVATVRSCFPHPALTVWLLAVGATLLLAVTGALIPNPAAHALAALLGVAALGGGLLSLWLLRLILERRRQLPPPDAPLQLPALWPDEE